MDVYSFDAIGTRWSVTVDGMLSSTTRHAITTWLALFENQFSRFIPTSEVHAYTIAGTHTVSSEMATLLHKASELRTLTNGVYDPAVASVLAHAGYDTTYSFTEKEGDVVLANWSLEGHTLTTSGPVVFDFGGMGKGYAIDHVSRILREHGHHYFLVEAGGDMYGTEKHNGDGWRVALAYPGNDELSIGTVTLRNQALAVSDSFRRRWGNWHHIVSASEKRSIVGTVFAAAVAPNAWDADCMTSASFMTSEYDRAAKLYDASYIVGTKDMKFIVSDNWEGEVF